MLKGVVGCLLIVLSIGQVRSQDWLLDMEEARLQANKEEKHILLIFQGSDWCAPCIRLEAEIWHSEVFKSYAAENLVLLKADFPKRKANRLSEEQTKKNELLVEKYNEQGAFPFVVVMDKNGKILRQASYENISPEEYIANLKSLK